MSDREYGAYITDDYDIDLELVPWSDQTFGPVQYARVEFAYYNTKTGTRKNGAIQLPPDFDIAGLEKLILDHVGHSSNRS